MTFHPTSLDKERIQTIGRMMLALPAGKKSAVCVDRGGKYKGKAAWYVAQFQEKFPALLVERTDAMTKDIDVITVHSPPCQQN